MLTWLNERRDFYFFLNRYPTLKNKNVGQIGPFKFLTNSKSTWGTRPRSYMCKSAAVFVWPFFPATLKPTFGTVASLTAR